MVITYSDIKGNWVDWIIVSIESLYTQISTDVPQWYCLVARATHEQTGVWLEFNWVYWVDMASVGKFTFASNIEVPQFDSVIHAAGKQEVASVMEVNLPHRLSMLCECVGTTGINKVPHFDSAISWTGGQEISLGIEGQPTNPVLMALTTHD